MKRGHANLLPGRAHTYYLGPLTVEELDNRFDTDKALRQGTLPGVWNEAPPLAEKTLRSYAATYLKEEIQAENLSRNLEGFARFLNEAAARSGHFLDLSKIAATAQVARQSVVRFFEILEDSLIVLRVPAFSKSAITRTVKHPKFYFFDVGVLNGLLGNFTVSSDRVGLLFEHLLVTQIHHTAQHRDEDIQISTYRTEGGSEVDLVVERRNKLYAIEIKSAQTVSPQDLRGVRSFQEALQRPCELMVLYRGTAEKRINGISIFPWQKGIQHLFS